MKTPMQEHIEWLKEERDLYGYEKQAYFETAIEHAESMLDKEEEMIKKAWWAGCDEGASDHKIYPSEDCNGYYNEIFKTKENE